MPSIMDASILTTRKGVIRRKTMSDTSNISNASSSPESTAPAASGAPAQAQNTQSNPILPVAEGQDPNAQAAMDEHKAEVAKKIRKLKLKVDGKEFEEELPFEFDDKPEIVAYLQKELQLSRMGQKRANESSEYKKQLDGVGKFLAEAKGNPAKVRELMKELGVDEKSVAASIIEEEMERAKKSPEQLEREKMEGELRSLKEEREQEKKDYETREFQRLQEQESQRYDTAISSALEKSDLPKSPYVVKKMAEYLLLGLQNNVDVTPEELLPLVREEIHNDLRQMFSVMPEEVIEQMIGKDTLKRLRKRNIAQAAPAAATKAIQDTGSRVESKTPEKKVSFKDYFKM